MRWVLAATVAALLTGCGSGNVEHSQRPTSLSTAASRQPPAAQAIEQPTSCPLPRTTLIVGTRHLNLPPSGSGPRRITMLAGHKMLVRSAGICAGAVQEYPQNARLRAVDQRHGSHVRVTSFEAVHPGVVRLLMGMPICARPGRSPAPACRGGLRLWGTTVVTVKPFSLPG
jgi:hypothetical protein